MRANGVVVAALAVLRNPFAGVDQDELTELFELAQRWARNWFKRAWSPSAHRPSATARPPSSAPLARLSTARLLHPRLGKPVRAAIGGGQALMASIVKLGGLGCFIDQPLGHKGEAWSFDHIDTLSIAVPDAPLPNEIVVCVGMSDGARPRARVGKGPS